MRRTVLMVVAVGLVTALNACGEGADSTSAGSATTTAPETKSEPARPTSSTTPTPSATPTPTVRHVPPVPLFVGGGAGLETLHSTALQVAGEEAWGHVVAVERIRNVVLMLRTDWTTATVDEEQANLVCAGVYTWMQTAGGYGSPTGITSSPFDAVALYENTPPGEQVFAC